MLSLFVFSLLLFIAFFCLLYPSFCIFTSTQAGSDTSKTKETEVLIRSAEFCQGSEWVCLPHMDEREWKRKCSVAFFNKCDGTPCKTVKNDSFFKHLLCQRCLRDVSEPLAQNTAHYQNDRPNGRPRADLHAHSVVGWCTYSCIMR